MQKINSFIKRTKFLLLSAFLARYALSWAALLLAFFFLLSVLRLAGVPGSLLETVFFAGFTFSVVAAAAAFVIKKLPYFSDRNIVVFIQERFPQLGDDLLSAWELGGRSSPWTSSELIEALITSASERLPTKETASAVPFRKLILKPALALVSSAAACLIVFAANPSRISDLAARIALQGSGSWPEWYSVKPGSAVLPWGNPATIVITGMKPIPGKPDLFIENERSGWTKTALEESGKGAYSYSIARLVEKVSYRISWNEIETGEFLLSPDPPPQLGNYEITYTYPSYTGLPPATVKGNPNISAPAGSSAQIKAVCSKEVRSAELYASWKARYPAAVSRGNRITASMKLRQSGTYKFIVEDASGITDDDPPEYAVMVTPDKPPAVELASPDGDLFASLKDEIPLIIEASDDYGLSRIELVFRVNQNPYSRAAIELPPPRTYSRTLEYRWRLSETNAKPGDKLTYYVEAWDNDTVNGPKSTATGPQSIETTDYEIEHKKIEKDLESFRKDLLKILADQMSAKTHLKNVSLQFTPTGYALLGEGQLKVSSGFKPPVSSLTGLIKRMEADPFTDYSTFSEFKGMLSHLEYLERKPAPDALKAVENRDWNEAAKNQNEIIAVLEKLTLLSEDIWQYQKMRDMFDNGASLEKTASDLLDKLRNGKPQPDELRKKLAEINDLLDKIYKQLSSMPQELPEDFVNSPAVKELDIGKSKSLAERLSEAIEKGDFETAKKLAEELSAQLNEMLTTMQKAGEEVGFSGSSSQKLEQELVEQKAALDKLIRKQEEILQKTEKLDDKRRQELFRKQEGLLSQLAEKQRALIKAKEDVKSSTAAKLPFFEAMTQQADKQMRLVLAEFEQKRVYHSQKYLDNIIKEMESEKTVLNGNAQLLGTELAAQLSAKTLEVQAGEKEILDRLKQRIADNMFSQNDRDRMDGLSGEQDELSRSTKEFRKSLEEFSRKSSAVPPDAFENLDGASSDMKAASGKLGEKDTPGAMDSGRSALDKLQSGMGALQEAGEQMSGQSGNSGKPVAGSIQMRSGGKSGARTAPVKLPGIEEYKPPKEFRQDILDALREKYPKEFEKIIKEYYKRLTE